MAQEYINVGASANDGDGNPLRTAFIKTNNNFSQLFQAITGNLSVAGNIRGGNISSPGNISAQGQVQAAGNIVTLGYFVGNFAGNITGNITAAGTNTQVLYNRNGTVAADAGMTYTQEPNVFTILGEISSTGNTSAGNLFSAGEVSAVGNLTGSYVLADGSQLTNLPILYANSNVAGFLAAFGSNTITTTGNISAGTYTGITVSATANILGGNLSVSGTVTGTLATNAQPNITSVGSLNSLSVTANVVAGNVRTTGVVTATGNITGGNVNTAGLITASGNVSGGNIDTSGLISAFGNIFSRNNISAYGIVYAANVIATTFYGDLVGNVVGNLIVPGSNTQVLFNTNGDANASSGFTFNTTGNILTVSGNITGSNVNGVNIFGGSLSVSGNVQFGNVRATTISASGNIQAGNLGAEAVLVTRVSAFGNVQAGNVLTSSSISAVGNITGGNIFTANTVSVGGNVQAPSILATTVSAAGNVFSGNIFSGIVSASGNVFGSALRATTGTINTGNLALFGNLFNNYETTINLGNLATTVNIGNSAGTVRFGNLASAVGNMIAAGFQYANGAPVQGSGAQGTTGNQGTTGPQGTTGAQGFNGSLGSQGTTGTQGTSGTTGAQGTSGTIGNNGSQGTTGAQGTAGTIGNNGSQGTTGAQGTNGNNGSQGATGPSTTINATTTSTNANYYPVFVAATGSDQTASANSNFYINPSTNILNTTAVQAQYADLAECYLADADYPPGTVVSFGGDYEVTLSTADNDQLLAGIISTAPAYKMNSGLKGDHVVALVLAGRAPCFCVGPVRAGDFMVSDGTGRARAEDNPNTGAIIGKAIKGFDGNIGVIEVLVGRF